MSRKLKKKKKWVKEEIKDKITCLYIYFKHSKLQQGKRGEKKVK